MLSKSFQDLGADIDDILVCSSETTTMFTKGNEYIVQQADDGVMFIMTDCGFPATTSASLFTIGKLREGYPVHPLPESLCNVTVGVRPYTLCPWLNYAKPSHGERLSDVDNVCATATSNNVTRVPLTELSLV